MKCVRATDWVVLRALFIERGVRRAAHSEVVKLGSARGGPLAGRLDSHLDLRPHLLFRGFPHRSIFRGPKTASLFMWLRLPANSKRAL